MDSDSRRTMPTSIDRVEAFAAQLRDLADAEEDDGARWALLRAASWVTGIADPLSAEEEREWERAVEHETHLMIEAVDPDGDPLERVLSPSDKREATAILREANSAAG
jgi:hypothetical protein